MNPLLVLVTIVVLILIYDAYLQLSGGEVNTISVRFYIAARKYPIIPFIAGYLLGHLTWGNIGVCG